MGRFDRLDIAVATGIFATLLGGGIFFFASGGAPYAFLPLSPQDMKAVDINPVAVTQASLGNAIVRTTQLDYQAESRVGMDQTRLGEAIVAAAQLRESERALTPGFQDSATRSQARMEGMIQERAGKSIVLAAQRAWRATEAGQLAMAQARFQETLGSIQTAIMAMRQSAAGQQQQSLGWMVVGNQVAMNQNAARIQELLGSALVKAGMTRTLVDEGIPAAQESLGGSVVVASTALTPFTSPVLTASAEPAMPLTRGEPLPVAAIILFAAVFVMGWGIRTIAQSAVSMPSYDAQREETRYRRAG